MAYDASPVENALFVQTKDTWFKHSIVLNGLRHDKAHLFDLFVPRRSMNEGTTSIVRCPCKVDDVRKEA